jgi:hypothetical protein
VERHYALREELPFTEWMQGQLVLKKTGDGIVHVYYNDKKIN